MKTYQIILLLTLVIGCKEINESLPPKEVLITTDKSVYYYSSTQKDTVIKLNLYNGTDSTIIHWVAMESILFKDSTGKWVAVGFVDNGSLGPILPQKSKEISIEGILLKQPQTLSGFYKFSNFIVFDTTIVDGKTQFHVVLTNEFEIRK